MRNGATRQDTGPVGLMDVEQAIDDLYGQSPSAFTARRDALAAEARQAGDRDLAATLKSLRKPSVAAYTVNLMTRVRPEEMERLIGLGEQLRAAQAALSGEDLRALGRQRSQLVAGLAHEARQVAREAGNPMSDATAREVQATFEAGLADPEAGQAVLAGRLVRALERSGMDPVDLTGAVAGGTDRPRPARRSRPAASAQVAAPKGGRGRSAEAGKDETARAAQVAAEAAAAEAAAEAAAAEAAAAEERLRRAQDERDEAVADHAGAEREVSAAEAAVERLAQELQSARRALDEAETVERRARRRRREAEDAATAAEHAATTAGAEVRRTRRAAQSLEPT